MDKKACPFCGIPDLELKDSAELTWVECRNPACGAQGPMKDTPSQAVAAWNLAIRVPTDPKAVCKHLTWCPCCNPALEARK